MTLPIFPQFVAQGYRAMMAGKPNAAADAFASQAWDEAAQVWMNPATEAWRETGKPVGESREEYVALIRGSSPNRVQYVADRVILRAERFGSAGNVLTLLSNTLRETRMAIPRVLPGKETWKNLRHRGLRKAFKEWLSAAYNVPSHRNPAMEQSHRQLQKIIGIAMDKSLKTVWVGRWRSDPLPGDMEQIVNAFYLALSDPRIGGRVAIDFPGLTATLRKNGFLEEDFFQTLLKRARRDLGDPLSVAHEKTLTLFLEKNDPPPAPDPRPKIAVALPEEISRRVEALSGYDHQERIRALEILEESVPHITIPQRWEVALKIGERLFLPPTSGAFRRSCQALSNCLPHLEGCPELPDFLERAETGITDRDPNVRLAARRTLRITAPHLPRDEKTIVEAAKALNTAGMDTSELKRQVARLAYAYGNTLSYGAIRALLLAGRRVIAEGNTNGLGDHIKGLGDRWRKEEKRYRGHPTLGGKIRKEKGSGERWGFPSGPRPLVRGENRPILLYPVGSPAILTRTLWDLAWSDPEEGPLDFRFSLALSGKAEDDLRPAVLGVYSLLRSPPQFPPNVTGEAGIKWYAPVVDGGGFVTDLHQLGNVDEEGRLHRYDYLFLGFERPPNSIEYFDTAGAGDSRWVEAMQTFLQESHPRLTAIDMQSKTLGVTFEFEGTSHTQDWKPAQRDWETIVAAKNHKAFERFFFLEWARRAFFDEIADVIESAWVLGMLREIEKGKEGFIPFSEGFTGERLRRLMALATRYRNKIQQLFQEAGVADVLETPWVGNGDWQKIRKDQFSFQKALKEIPFGNRLRDLVLETVREAREILLPDETDY